MKKVLSFVLILALVLSSFSMAFAGSTTELKELSDIAGNANEEAIEVNYDLNIITGNPDGTFQPEKAVNRAEFAAMITRALAIPDSALAAYSTSSFKDTTGYTWAVPYLAFTNSKGIMLGDGAGNAMPGKTITVNEAVTMALRAIGYTANSSELTGVWPSNYVTKAQELKLYDDVAKDATGVDKANAAQIIYNILGVQKVAVNSDGKTDKLWDVEPNAVKNILGVPTTLLSAGLNCTTDGTEVVTAADVEDSLINMAKNIGKFGSIYRNSDDEVVAFIEESDATLNGRFYQDGSTLKFVATADETEYTVNATTAQALLVNGVGSNTEFNFRTDNAVAAKVIDGTVKSHNSTEFAISVDLTGKTIKEIYGINTWVADQADQVSKTDIADIKEDQSLLNEDFPTTDNEIDYTKFAVVGVKSLSDIKEDNVVYVYTANDDIIKVEVGTAVAEGVVKNYKEATKDQVATKFAIGANTYKNAAEVLNGAAVGNGSCVDDSDVSDSVKAFLDARGFVYDFENTSKADNYAVVKKLGSLDQAQLVLADGTTKTMDYDDATDKAGVITAPALIGYGLNNAGTITEANKNFVKATAITLSSVSVIKDVDGAAQDNGALSPTSASAIKGNLKIASDCVVFTYDDNGTMITDLDVTTIDKVELNQKIAGKGVFLLFDQDNNKVAKTDKVVAMLIPDSMAKGGDKSYAVVNERNSDANDDGDKVWKVIGYNNGTKMNTLTDDKSAMGTWSAPVYDKANKIFKNIFVYEVKVDANGVVTKGTAITADKATDNDVYRTMAFVAGSADGRKSVVADTTILTQDPNATTLESVNNGERYAISSKAVFYQVTTDNEFKLYSSGDLKDGDVVQLFETNGKDKDNDGFDIVVFFRK